MKKYVGFIMLFGICVSAQIDLVEDIRLDSNEKYESQEGETNSSNKNTPTHEVPKTYTVSEVSEMAVYLGCEEFKDSKHKSQQCLSQKLSEVLMIELEPIVESFIQKGIKRAETRIQLVINKEGKMTDIETLAGGNRELANAANIALKRIARRWVKEGIFLAPAKLEDGTPVDLVFEIPVKFVAQ